MRVRVLLTIALLLAVPVSAQAADLYVNPHAAGCSDVVGPDVAGHAATPWCSPTPALGLARPGDVVHLASATYGAQLRPLSSGTAAQPIVYQADGPVVIAAPDGSAPPLQKKHPAALDGVKFREEAAMGEITPAPRGGPCRDSAGRSCEPANKTIALRLTLT